jgi:phage terminase large subunit GpA-like protein
MLLNISLSKDPHSIVGSTLAQAFAPPATISVSEFVRTHITVGDGPRQGERVDLELTPYLKEILDTAHPDSGVTRVVCRKGAQQGLTLALSGIAAYKMVHEDRDGLLVQPTHDALKSYSIDKLGRIIDASPILRKTVRPQTSRSGKDSSASVKRFRANSLTLAVATSAPALSSRTVSYALKDEVARWPAILSQSEGSPHDLIAARMTAFTADRSSYTFEISTPTLSGDYIDTAFEGGTQKYWHCPCKECGEFFAFRWENIKYNDTKPYNPYTHCPQCGCIVTEGERDALIRKGKWIATIPGAPYESYQCSCLISPFTRWSDAVEKFLAINDDQELMRAWCNLWLGVGFTRKGNTPEWERLFERREVGFERGVVPAGTGLLVITCDVQNTSIIWSALAFAADRQWHVVDYGIAEGATDVAEAGAFVGLDALYHKQWPTSSGNLIRPNEFGIDMNFHTGAVLTWVKNHPGAKALQGRGGWHRPPLSTASDVEIDYQGRRTRRGVKLRGVGTDNLKLEIMDRLAIAPIADGAEVRYPPRYFHVPAWCEDVYLRQLCSEHVVPTLVRNKIVMRWEPINKHNPNNHWLDCAVMAWALVDPWFNALTEEQWDERLRAWHGQRIEVEQDEPAAPVVEESQPVEPERPDDWDSKPPAPAGMVGAEPVKKNDQDEPKTTDNAPNPFDQSQAMQNFMERLAALNDDAFS